jgi:hypothetical protein
MAMFFFVVFHYEKLNYSRMSNYTFYWMFYTVEATVYSVVEPSFLLRNISDTSENLRPIFLMKGNQQHVSCMPNEFLTVEYLFWFEWNIKRHTGLKTEITLKY